MGITDTAAAQAARALGFTPARARAFLEQQVSRGRVVTSSELPHPYAGKRSKTGQFLLIDHVLALPLATDSRDPRGFTATGCLLFEEYLRTKGRTRPTVDPYTLRGAELMAQVKLSEHAVQRYHERAGGHHDLKAARDQMRQELSRDARAVRQRPRWTNSRNTADLFLLAGGADGQEEFCLPMSRHGGGGKPLEALTCLHRSMPLFELTSSDLAKQVAFTEDVLTAFDRLYSGEQSPAVRFKSAIAASGTLSWHPPAGHPHHPRARFYLIVGSVFVPVAWDKTARVPLIALDVHQAQLPILKRATAWLRRRFSPRLT
ncbi:hypothetical protein ACRYCC_27120 [Actinomadura scrupuli]|uniref:hypothetical protein n=1 Tax=Actinomadura scrupuli TaxID=559629 RepID=UPI003D97732E